LNRLVRIKSRLTKPSEQELAGRGHGRADFPGKIGQVGRFKHRAVRGTQGH